LPPPGADKSAEMCYSAAKSAPDGSGVPVPCLSVK